VGSSGKRTNNEGSNAAGSGALPVHNSKVHRKSGKTAGRSEDLLKTKVKRQKVKITDKKKKTKNTINNNKTNKK
jgi:hypothetical protein